MMKTLREILLVPGGVGPAVGRLVVLVAVGGSCGLGLAGLRETPRSGPRAPRTPAIDSRRHVAVGERVPAFALRGLEGAVHSQEDFRSRQATVLAFNGVGCPISKVYAPRIERLHQRFAARGVLVLGLNANVQDGPDELAAFVARYGLTFPMAQDVGAVVADLLGVERVTDVFVVDGEGILRYRGRFDDQYTITAENAMGVRKPESERDFVADALEAILAGRAVPVAETESVGCVLGRDSEPPRDAPYTFYRDVEPILQRHCQSCHRPGEIGPFPLLTFEDASGWSGMIAEVVRERRMPPWHADPAHGRFSNARRLSDEELATTLAWIDDACPPGDPHQRPAPRRFATGWRIGEPDLVLAMEKPFTVPAEGVVDYHHAILDRTFAEDTWVQAVEIQPGVREVVHHIMVFVIAGQNFNASDWFAEFDGGKHGYFALMVPGEEPTVYPPGMAKKIPAGSRLMMTIHYTPDGVTHDDRSRLGLRLAEGPVRHPAFTESAFNDSFRLAPGARDVPIHSAYLFDRDTVLVTLNPHMHYRGRSFVYKAHYPRRVSLSGPFDVDALPNHVRPRTTWDPAAKELSFVGWMSWTEAGLLAAVATSEADREAIKQLKLQSTSEILLDVPRYDFAWQTMYRLEEPKLVPAGTLLTCEARYDNSVHNPYLTEALAAEEVRWGLQSSDEMMLGYFDYYYPDGFAEPQRVRDARRRVVGKGEDD